MTLYGFGEFRLDAENRRLYRENGETVTLTPRVFDLLLAFVESGGRVLTKDELLEKVWSDTIVEESNLSQSVFVLRKALNETAHNPRFIRTVPASGYRFIAPVSIESGNGGSGSAVATVSPRIKDRNGEKLNGGNDSRPFGLAEMVPLGSGRRITSGRVAIVGLAAIGVLASFWLYAARAGRSTKAPEMARITNIGTVTESNISPDGKYVAYSHAENGGRFSIWLKVIGEQSEVQVLPPTDGSCFVINFMPDGRSLQYGARDKDGNPASYVMPLFGGNSVKTPLNYATRVAFSPDGKRKVYMDGQLSQGLNFLMIAKADGSDARPLATRRHPNAFILPGPLAWSSDGKRIACVAIDENAAGNHISVVDSETGEETAVSKGEWNTVGGIAWLPDNSGMIVTATKETSAFAQVWTVSFPDGVTTRITNDTNYYVRANLSGDGKTLITQEVRSPSSIWVAPVKGEVGAENDTLSIDLANAVKISSGQADGHGGQNALGYIEWTPDDRLVFVSRDSGNEDLWSVHADGTGRMQLTTDPHRDTAGTVSPDGKTIAFNSNRTGRYNLWLMDIDGQNQRRITDGKVDWQTAFHPSGQWIYFRSWGTGIGTVWRIPVDGGQPEQVVEQASVVAALSPDAKWLLYVTRDPIAYALRLLEGGPVVRTFNLAAIDQVEHVRWLASSNAFSFRREHNGFQQLWLQPINGGPPRVLTNLTENVNSYGWSRDGKKIALAIGTTTTDLISMRLAD